MKKLNPLSTELVWCGCCACVLACMRVLVGLVMVTLKIIPGPLLSSTYLTLTWCTPKPQLILWCLCESPNTFYCKLKLWTWSPHGLTDHVTMPSGCWASRRCYEMRQVSRTERTWKVFVGRKLKVRGLILYEPTCCVDRERNKLEAAIFNYSVKMCNTLGEFHVRNGNCVWMFAARLIEDLFYVFWFIWH